jgi:Lrp/AsnC family leucine-responsive transcriptional regulator
MERLDANDMQILNLLQGDGRIANAEIARQVGLAPSAVLERIRKMEERGVIEEYRARLSPKMLGCGLTAFTLVRANWLDSSSQAEALAKLPQVQEVHEVAGEDCFLIKLRVKDTDALARLLRDQIGSIPGVTSTRTTIVLSTFKETTEIPVGPREETP